MAFSFVSEVRDITTGTVTSFPSPSTSLAAGNHNAVFVRFEASAAVVTVTDTAGNTYVPLAQVAGGGTNVFGQWFYCLNAAFGNASNVVTATFDVARSYVSIQVIQFSSASAASLDTSAPGSVSADMSVSSAAFNTAGAGVVLAGQAAYSGDSSPAFSAGYTVLTSPFAYSAAAYKVSGAALTGEIVTYTGTTSTSRAISVLALKEGGGTDTPVNPAVGTVALTGYAPTVAQSANQSVAPSAGSLAITGYAPTIAQPHAVNPGAGSLAITGYAPTVTQAINQAVNPGVGSVVITGYAPSIAQSANQLIAANVGSVALTGYAPSVAQSAHQAITPNVGTLTITGYAPSVTQESASRTVLPNVGSLTITGYAPVVAQSGGQDGFGGVPFFHSEQATKYRRRKAEEEVAAIEAKVETTVEPVIKAVESAIVKVAKQIDLTETKAKATLALKAELKRQEIAYEKLYAKQLEEQRNARLIQELQDLIQQDLEEQDEEEAMLLLM